MIAKNQPLSWEFDPYDPYFPITYEGVGVGFCKLDFAVRIADILNEEGKLRKALQMACLDLLKQSGGNPEQVQELVNQYLEKTECPKHGTGAIACLLRDRQEELDMSDKDFARFCDSYKLSAEELKNIYGGKEVTNRQLGILARILRKSMGELTEIRDGVPEPELDLKSWKTPESRIQTQKSNRKTKLFSIRKISFSQPNIAGTNSD